MGEDDYDWSGTYRHDSTIEQYSSFNSMYYAPVLGQWYPRHTKLNNYVYVDGHAEKIKHMAYGGPIWCIYDVPLLSAP